MTSLVVPAPRPRLLTRLRHVVRTRVAESPTVYLPFARTKYPGPSPEVIGPETQLVIDGYTRSASTFAVYALQLAQDRPVRLAHHLHAPAQLVEAARRKVPGLLLIREPQGAILSQLVREPGIALRDALIAYARFYDRLLPYLDRLVVADFETVTQDFGSVIRRLNTRFGMSLAEFAHTDASLTDCFAFIEQRGRHSPVLLGFESGLVAKDTAIRELRALQEQGPVPEEGDAWMPSAQRRRAKEELMRAWEAAELGVPRTRASLVYQLLLASAQESS
jgi:hypothetical protein